uniref:Uncharacterized protein n=1 Tax=Moniliophthora roreri TaxID=221103 RepID=A0A0W0F3X0_MONRR
MRRLPAESWMNIFTEVCSSDENALSATYRKITAPPIALSHVCSRWREIINNLPQLWTSISVDMYNLQADVRNLVTLFGKRSKGHSLKIQIHHQYPLRAAHRPMITSKSRRAFRALLAHAHQCGELHFELSAEETRALKSSDLIFSFPRLRTFDCHTDLVSTLEHGWLFDSLRRGLPSLEVFRVETALGTDVIPYPQLTTLSIDGHRGACWLLEVLRTCRSLRSLTIGFETASEEEDEEEFAPVVLPDLRKFSVRVAETFPCSVLAPLCSTLSLPSLESLEIASAPDPDDDDEWPPSLPTMIQSASATLRELSFRSHGKLSYPLNEILRSCPSLACISFWEECQGLDSTFVHDIFTILTISPSASSAAVAVAPRLTHLKLHFSQWHGLRRVEGLRILSMAESRARNRLVILGLDPVVVALQDVRILYDCYVPHAKLLRCPLEHTALKERVDALANENTYLSISSAN